jgi:uncharacterized membrane protein
MRRFRPVYGFAFVALFVAAVWIADTAIEGGAGYGSYALVGPDAAGAVRVDLAGLGPGEVRFYRFLNRGNQEVMFFVGRDEGGQVQVAFDANEICFKRKRGYAAQDGWLVCRVCDKAFRLSEVNAGGGGCKPIPLAHRVEGGAVVLAEADVLQGWRYFR